MRCRAVKVLAVADPAVLAYVDPGLGILDRWRAERREVDFDILPWDRYYPTLLAQREKPEYDIAMIAGHLWLRDFAESGAILPLDEGFRSLPPSYGEDDLVDALRREAEWEGRRWLVPSFTDGHLIFYDAKAAADAGVALAPAVDPRGFASFARALCGGSRRLALKACPSEIFLDWLPYLLGEGAEPFDAEGRPTFRDERGLRALEAYLAMRDIALEGCAGYGNEGVRDALLSGRALLGASWGGQAAGIASGKRGRFGFATFERPWNVAWSFAILSGTRRADEAFALLAYLSSREVDKAVGRFAGSPVRSSSYADPAEAAACPWYPVQLDMIRRAYTLPRLRSGGELFGVLYEELSRAFAGRVSPAEALAGAEGRINDIRQRL
jgi:multiple sugar transport system substrate-binding protein